MKILATLLALAIASTLSAAEQSVERDIPYSQSSDAYARQRCALDVKYQKGESGRRVLVWFHGGGITSGSKHFPANLPKDFVVVAANYRLSPKASAEKAIEDAAEAVAWTFKNIEKFGGDPKKIFVSGHSAGAYLAGMVGFNPEYLGKFGIKNTDIAGLALVSGQATTHFRVRSDLGDKSNSLKPKIDRHALLGNLDNPIPPLCLILGDRRIEFPERVEENLLLASAVKNLKLAKIVEIHELQGLNHVQVGNPAGFIIDGFSKKVCGAPKGGK